MGYYLFGIEVFHQTESTATKAEERLNPVKPEDVGIYLSALKKENKGATIYDLCKKFRIEDDFEMATLIGELEKAGKAIMNGFKPGLDSCGSYHLTIYTGSD